MACECSQNWRIELVSLTTGETNAAIVPESFEFSTRFMQPGRGSISYYLQGVLAPVTEIGGAGSGRQVSSTTVREAYPGDYGIVFSRVAGGAATWESPVHMFVGQIDSASVSSSGLVSLGLVELTDYMDHRLLRNTATFSNEDQRVIAAKLVNYIGYGNYTYPPTDGAIDTQWNADENSRLRGSIGFGPAEEFRDRTYLAEERPVVGEMLRNLISVENGPVYRMEPFRDSSGVWTFLLRFYNQSEWLELFPVTPLIVWDDVVDATSNLDRRERATLIEVFGTPQADGSPRIVTRTVEGLPFAPFIGGHVRHDATTTYDSATTSVLEDYGDGQIFDRFDNAGFLPLNLAGVDYGTGEAASLTIDAIVPGAPVNVLLQAEELPWQYFAGPDIPAFFDGETPVTCEDLAFGEVSVSAQASGPEKVTAEVMTSRPFMPIKYEGNV